MVYSWNGSKPNAWTIAKYRWSYDSVQRPLCHSEKYIMNNKECKTKEKVTKEQIKEEIKYSK